MPPTLYHVTRTISSPLVQLLLELNIVDKQVSVQELTFPDLKSKNFMKINPMGTSPAFQDTELGITMWESGAILDHLLETYDVDCRFHPPPPKPNSTPQDIQKRAKYLQLKQYIIATVYPFIASMFIHSLKPPKEQDAEYMITAKKKCHTVFGPVLSEWLGDGPYFLGETISVIDFLAVKPLTNVKQMGLLQEFPKLDALYQLVSSRESYQLAFTGLKKKAPENPKKKNIDEASSSSSSTLRRQAQDFRQCIISKSLF